MENRAHTRAFCVVLTLCVTCECGCDKDTLAKSPAAAGEESAMFVEKQKKRFSTDTRKKDTGKKKLREAVCLAWFLERKNPEVSGGTTDGILKCEDTPQKIKFVAIFTEYE